MRFAAAVSRVVLWLATTVALAVAIPAAWAQVNLIDEGGYTEMARKAAGDPAVQEAVAAELTTRTVALITEHGGRRHPVDSSLVHEAATAFTVGGSFPPLFAEANRAAHRWLFTETLSGQNPDRWVVDISPMLNDDSFQLTLRTYQVKVPATLAVPLSVSVPKPVRQGQLRRLAVWGPWVSIGAVALTGVCGLLTLVAARSRGKALTSLGVSALLVGAGGWAGIEVGGRYINDALNRTTGDMRRIAEAMVSHAEDSLHLWFNLTLAGGAALVILGVLVAMLGTVLK
ncbi:hypothetical protein [Mycobacterium decipiens]|uniref:Uncharacterized protein n=1 Tax=Mycobacterium decipiens TaxID=1430326 RepID=A0A1X2LZD6_9MYCO|nr:hypothetical protein [Mycobacterium decipiens]OSC42657.1 hypothetical protein B8W66_03725 [Mycobacterium decipiens]